MSFWVGLGGCSRIRARTSFVLLTAVAVACAGAPGKKSQQIARLTTENFLVPSADGTVSLCVRNRHPADAATFEGDHIVLFVHGATYPSETAFDMDLPGGSWMDYAASRGYDAYFVDVRGYGCSSRPAAMAQPPETNAPVATTAEAVKDVGTAIDFILQRRHASKLNLVGWSWGTTLMAGYTAEHNDRVNKLVLYGPLWLIKGLPPVAFSTAYRSLQKDAVRKRTVRGIPDQRLEEVSPTAWFDKWWAANLATDPEGGAKSPPVLRAPNGAMRDILQEYWVIGKPTYDPANIRVPTLLIVGAWDQDTPLYMAQELFAQLVNTPTKRHVVLAEGTHAVVLERNRMQLIREVQSFLDQ
jgi:pimeloyl-ACP methyl ester carboxylesterase